MDSILLDTSFCIRLLKNNDELHQNAKDYFKYIRIAHLSFINQLIICG
jgi:predicted nucleic acid-binding protein